MRNFLIGLTYLMAGAALVTVWAFLFWPEWGGFWVLLRLVAIICLTLGLGSIVLGLFLFWLPFLVGLASRRKGRRPLQ